MRPSARFTKMNKSNTNILSKSPRSSVSYCFPGFPGALPGFPWSPGVSSYRVQRVSEVSRRSLEGSRRFIFRISVNLVLVTVVLALAVVVVALVPVLVL